MFTLGINNNFIKLLEFVDCAMHFSNMFNMPYNGYYNNFPRYNFHCYNTPYIPFNNQGFYSQPYSYNEPLFSKYYNNCQNKMFNCSYDNFTYNNSYNYLNTNFNSKYKYQTYNDLKSTNIGKPSTTATTKVYSKSSAANNSVKKTQSNSNVDYIPENADLNWWKAQGYDVKKGRELSLNAYNKPHKGKSGECVGYTRKTINEIYGTTFDNAGAAENFGYKILSAPELKAKGGYFKRYRINGIKPSQVPDGAILIWPHTAYSHQPNSKAALYGHGGIAHDGKVYSNCVCVDLSKCNEIWIPVTA